MFDVNSVLIEYACCMSGIMCVGSLSFFCVALFLTNANVLYDRKNERTNEREIHFSLELFRRFVV